MVSQILHAQDRGGSSGGGGGGGGAREPGPPPPNQVLEKIIRVNVTIWDFTVYRTTAC